MIITKYALYETLQSAFSTHHPRFPWPKKHDLIDQTPAFQKAFDEFASSVNEVVRDEIIEHKKIERDHYVDKVERLEKELKTATWWNGFFAFAFGIALGAFALGFLIGYIG